MMNLKLKKKKFDLIGLEDNLIQSYRDYLDIGDQPSRTHLFLDIKSLAFAILSVSHEYKTLDNHDNVSYEYALYLFERILLGKFKPESYQKNRFPWQVYVSKNLKHVAYNIRDDFFWRDQIKDLEYLVGDEQSLCEYVRQSQGDVESFDSIVLGSFSEKLLKALHIFYKSDDIKRLLPLSMDVISNKNSASVYTKEAPHDLNNFSTILIALVKRLSLNDKKDKNTNKNSRNKLFTSAIRSSIFLSTISNSKLFPKELFLCTDMDSIYRLVHVIGGKTLKIPTEKDLNSLLGAVVSVSKLVTDGKGFKKSLNESKNEYDLLFSKNIKLEAFIENIVETLGIFGEEKPKNPVISLIMKSLSNIDILLKPMIDEKMIDKTSQMLITVRSLKKTLEKLETMLSNERNV